MAASGSIIAANAMVDALRRGDEASAVGLIDRVIGAAHLGNCLLSAMVCWFVVIAFALG